LTKTQDSPVSSYSGAPRTIDGADRDSNCAIDARVEGFKVQTGSKCKRVSVLTSLMGAVSGKNVTVLPAVPVSVLVICKTR